MPLGFCRLAPRSRSTACRRAASSIRCAGVLAPRPAGSQSEALIAMLEEVQALAVAFVSLAEGIDATTPAGKLQMHILGAIAEFERERIRERVVAGLQRAKKHGTRLGRPRVLVPVEQLRRVEQLPVDLAAERLGVSRSTVKRWRRQVQQSLSA